MLIKEVTKQTKAYDALGKNKIPDYTSLISKTHRCYNLLNVIQSGLKASKTRLHGVPRQIELKPEVDVLCRRGLSCG